VPVSTLGIAVFSAGATLFAQWLFRRDAFGRAAAVESQRVEEVERRIRALENDHVSQKDMDATKMLRVEIERRVHVIESEAVSQRDFNNLSSRLDSILFDLRDIRNFQLEHAGTK